MKPFVFRNGVIVFRRRMPPGALPITHLRSRRLRQIVDVLARHGRPEFGQSRKLMLLPGVPEARTESEALDAVLRFKREVEIRLQSPRRRAV